MAEKKKRFPRGYLLIGVLNPNYNWWGPTLYTSQNLFVVPLKTGFFCWASPPLKGQLRQMVHTRIAAPHLPCGTSLDLRAGEQSGVWDVR